jgi:transitional endoplasmic reticulum ATPase
VGLVNEMLTQMEQFNGIFIASTNRFVDLDEAAMRRFDFKISFGYLKPDRLTAMFVQCCEEWGLDMPDNSLLERIQRIATGTPGDLVALKRRHRVIRFKESKELFLALEAECQRKENQTQPIGFVHDVH